MKVPIKTYKDLTALREELRQTTKQITKLLQRQSWLIRVVRHYEMLAQYENIAFVRYGLTKEDYDKLLVAQNYKCAICETSRDSLARGLVVDHDHATGIVRGLLCHRCNKGIGLLKDNTTALHNAVAYLKRATRKS